MLRQAMGSVSQCSGGPCPTFTHRWRAICQLQSSIHLGRGKGIVMIMRSRRRWSGSVVLSVITPPLHDPSILPSSVRPSVPLKLFLRRPRPLMHFFLSSPRKSSRTYHVSRHRHVALIVDHRAGAPLTPPTPTSSPATWRP